MPNKSVHKVTIDRHYQSGNDNTYKVHTSANEIRARKIGLYLSYRIKWRNRILYVPDAGDISFYDDAAYNRLKWNLTSSK